MPDIEQGKQEVRAIELIEPSESKAEMTTVDVPADAQARIRRKVPHITPHLRVCADTTF